jgi:hypothetical protein
MKTDAQTCRDNGWKVGDLLKGTEVWGDDTKHTSIIQITAIGEEKILAKEAFVIEYARSGKQTMVGVDREEGHWTLLYRDWKKYNTVKKVKYFKTMAQLLTDCPQSKFDTLGNLDLWIDDKYLGYLAVGYYQYLGKECTEEVMDSFCGTIWFEERETT